MLLAAFGIFVVPYMAYLYEQLHQITFTGRTVRSVFAVIQDDNETYEFHTGSPITWALKNPMSAIKRVIDNDEYILRKHAIWAFHPVMTFLMALGLFGKPWAKTDLKKMTLFLVFLLLPWVSYYGVSGILNRYYTTSIILVSILAANGIVYLYDWFARSEAFVNLRNKYLPGKTLFYSLVVFAVFLTNLKPLAHPVSLGGYPEHGDQLKDYQVGEWIKNNVQLPHPAILCASPRVAYYGQGRFFGDNDRNLTMQALPGFITVNGIDILVVDDFFYEQWFPGLKDLKDPSRAPAYLKCIQAIPYRYDTGKQGVALIYQVINQ